MSSTSGDPLCGGAVQLLLHLAGHARDQATVGDLRTLQHHGTGRDYALRADSGVLQDYGIHADHRAVADRATLALGSVAYRDMLADDGRRPIADVYNTVVLDARACAHHDAVLGVVPSHHSTEPHARVLLDCNVTDEHGIGRDERGFGHSWPLAVEGKEDRHVRKSAGLFRLFPVRQAELGEAGGQDLRVRSSQNLDLYARPLHGLTLLRHVPQLLEDESIERALPELR